jgi:hypothetical protein
MDENETDRMAPSPEQLLYAAILEKGMYIGLACLIVTFILYVSGIMQPYIPLDKLSEYWKDGVHDYLSEAEIPTGWGWVSMLGYGDFVNFLGIVFLAGATVICYLSIIPLFFKKRDFIYAALALLEVIVLIVAASGVIAVGH